jgi:hypothetical protein
MVPLALKSGQAVWLTSGACLIYLKPCGLSLVAILD